MGRDRTLFMSTPKDIKINKNLFEKNIDNIDFINELILKNDKNKRRYQYLYNLYLGMHSQLLKPEKADWKPDNRLIVNFPRSIVETFQGYGYGIPIREFSDNDDFQRIITEFYSSNSISSHENALIRMCCIYGHSYEYMYQDEDGNTRVKAIAPTNCFVVYDDTLANKALGAIYYGLNQEETGYFGTLILPDRFIEFTDNGIINEPEPNRYGKISIVEWRLNDERMGLFEPAASLIETTDKVLSEKANDIDAFAEAYLAILGAELDENGVRRIRDNRLINLCGTDDATKVVVDFLQKPTADNSQENLLDRLEKLIYSTCMVCNVTDDTFMSALSGQALNYKVWSMSNLAKTFDENIKKSLSKRYKLLGALHKGHENSYKSVKIITTRNTPGNRTEEAQIVTQLTGVISHERQLSLLSFIEDPQQELEKIAQEEKQEYEKLKIYSGTENN